MSKQNVQLACRRLQETPFPDPPTSAELGEIHAELANISTFGSGCVDCFLKKGPLSPAHHSVLLNCRTALKGLGRKLAQAKQSGNGCDPEEHENLYRYKKALEQLLEAIVVGCSEESGDNHG